jgi:phosphoribosyl 1,2-cyclic phosphate phosphodiesterase
MILTFLGTGGSFGIPQVACRCEVCRSADPKDRRSRVGAVVETDGGTRILIDTPPELRLQMLAAEIRDVDAVLFTHDHADHVAGIDDLRAITVRRTATLPVFGSRETISALRRRFDYIFDDAIRPAPGTYKPEAVAQAVDAGVPFTVGDVEVLPLLVPHGPTPVFAYRIGHLGYVTDAKALPPEAVAALRGVRVLVINALFRTEHPTHLSIPEAVAAAQAVGAERTFFTHLTHRTSHAALVAELPTGIAPAYDGLTVNL